MKKFLFVFVASIIFVFEAVCQKETSIPDEYRPHPEYGKVIPRGKQSSGSTELIHLRTAHSRTFENNDGSLTTAVSAAPMHYLDENGWWHSIDYRLQLSETRDDLWVMPGHQPRFAYDAALNTLLWYDDEGEAMFASSERSIRFLDSSRIPLPDDAAAADESAMLTESAGMTFSEVFTRSE